MTQDTNNYIQHRFYNKHNINNFNQELKSNCDEIYNLKDR